MTDKTPNLALDYLMPDQAQKHITINESLRRLDGLVHLSVINRTTTAPPASPANGARYLLPTNASGAWTGHDHHIALYEDTGWQFVAPKAGWRLWDEANNTLLVYNGTTWQEISAGGGGLVVQTIEATLTYPNPQTLTIPSHTLLLGVTGRVTSTLNGNWRVGVAGSSNRFGSGLPAATDTTFQGLSNPPAVYWSPTPIVITGEGGAITRGTIKLVLYYLTLPIPS